MTVTETNTDPVTDLRKAEAALTLIGAFDRSGVPEKWPLSQAYAVTLLRAGMHYDVSHELIGDLIDRKILSRPSVDEDGRWEFNADDVCALAGLLEARKEYLPSPCAHDCKKHPTQINLEGCRRDGSLEEALSMGAAPRFDLRHLLHMLVASNDLESRTKLLALTKATLEVEHGVVIA